MNQRTTPIVLPCLALAVWLPIPSVSAQDDLVIGREVAIPRHLVDGDEHSLPLRDLLAHGARLFAANWTNQEGGGRPLTKGTGAPLSGPSTPLVFPDNFNRISAPDANSCAGCHNSPGPGGAGDPWPSRQLDHLGDPRAQRQVQHAVAADIA